MAPMVALLRGINVGRNKRVAMADLRALMVGLGYSDVSTLLQSGNVVFSCSAAAARTAVQDIERAVAKDLGVECAVIVRTGAEIAAAVAAAPLLELVTDPSRFFVGFLAATPSKEAVGRIGSIEEPPDQIRIVGREVYLWCPNGLLDSPITKLGWEKRLGVAVTARNWNTVNKIAALTTG